MKKNLNENMQKGKRSKKIKKKVKKNKNIEIKKNRIRPVKASL